MKSKEKKSEKNKNVNLEKHLSMRIDPTVYTVIDSLAAECGATRSQIARLAIDQELERYLGSVRYVSCDDAKAINHNIIQLGNLLSDLRRQIRKIGININQLAKARSILLKGKINFHDLDYLIKNQTQITREEIDLLQEKMDDIIVKIGEIDVFKDIS